MLRNLHSHSILRGLSAKDFRKIKVCYVNNISIRDDEIRLVKFIGRLVHIRKKSAFLCLRNKIKKDRIKFLFSLASPAVVRFKKLR